MNVRKLIATFILFAITSSWVAAEVAAQNVEALWRDTLQLTFIMEPIRDPEVFGVGAIIGGRGKKYYPYCFTQTCFPAKGKLLEENRIILSDYPRDRVTRSRTTSPFLKFLKLDMKGNRYEYVEIEFQGATQEQVDLVTAKLIIEEHLTAEGVKYMFDSKKPPKEFVILAVRCRRLNFKLYDKNDRAISLPTKVPAGAGWERIDDWTGAFHDLWFGIRTVILEKRSPSEPRVNPILLPPIHGKPGILDDSKEVTYEFKEPTPRTGLVAIESLSRKK